MTRFALVALVSCVLVSVAFADEAVARSLAGSEVVVDERPTVFLIWSMDEPAGVAELRALEAMRVNVVAVNTDPAARRSEIVPFLRRNGLSVDAVADPTGEVRARIGAGSGVGAVSVSTSGRWAWRKSDVAEFLASLAGPQVVASRP